MYVVLILFRVCVFCECYVIDIVEFWLLMKYWGLLFGDRVCLVLVMMVDLLVLIVDMKWVDFDLGIDI